MQTSNTKLLKKKAFTLVELIIVITILAILATIAFISFQGYSSKSRDSVRLSDLKNITTGLEIYKVKIGNFPLPEDGYTTIYASGTPISYQGYFGDNASKNIGMNKNPLDPLDNTKYIYATDINQKKYQLLTYLEEGNQTAFVSKTYALDYNIRAPKIFGYDLGILLNQDKSPITGTGIDILLANNSTTYKAYFNNEEITSTGNLLFSNIYNHREDLIINKAIANLDDSLVGYWDMETTIQSGGLTMLKDLSNYGHNGEIIGNHNIGTILTKNGKGTEIDGTGGIKIPPFNDLKSSNLTINVLFKASTLDLFDSNEKVWNLPYNGVYNNYYGIINQWDCTPTPPMTTGICNNKGPAWWLGAFDQVFSDTYTGSKVNDINGGIYNPIITMSGGTTSLQKDNTKNLLNGDWYLITLRKSNNNELTIYLNGTKYINANTFLGNILESNLPLYIGLSGHTLNSNISIGTFDEIRIYNRALSDSEIKALYSAIK